MARSEIAVSPEMTTFVGSGPVAAKAFPKDAILIRFDLDAAAPVFTIAPRWVDDAPLVCAVARGACERVWGMVPPTGSWHLPVMLREVALAIRDCALPDAARDTLRIAKSLELMCVMFEALAADALVPADGSGELSAVDAGRIAAARRLIDERWREKLTLDAIARACGLNRAKLTRGFRQLFDTSVADAIAERRLGGARAMLLATDLPVSSVGYACGYRNNAAFTRAFSRRFGVAPTRLRMGLAA